MIPVSYLVALAFIMFSIGAFGVIVRRNLIAVFMCVELMLNSANLIFVTFSQVHQSLDSQVAVLFVMSVAAAEAAVGLAIVLAVFRHRTSVDTTEVSELKD